MDGVNSGSNRRSAGRYTLEEAAQYVADNSTADAESMLSKLKGAAASLALTVYLTGSNERHTDMMRAASVRCGGEARGFRTAGGRIAQGDEEAYADDLNAWLAKNEPRLNWEFPTFHAPAATPAPVEQVKPLQRSAAQDAAILNKIAALGFDAKALPKNKPGKAGAKSAVRKSLSNDRLFTGVKVFDRAWERMSANGEIVIKK